VAWFFPVAAVSAVVVNAYSVAAICSGGRETSITIPVLAQPVQYLDDTHRVAVWLPGLQMYLMAVLSGQPVLFVM
jgi:hypothetical protein